MVRFHDINSMYPRLNPCNEAVYKPILEEVEKILAEAGLDEEEMRRGAAGGLPSAGGIGASRNRR